MTKLEFASLFVTAIEAFGKYSDLRRDRIFHFCQHLSPEEFRALIIKFIDEGIKPDVKDFRAHSNHMKNRNTQELFPNDEILCDRCQDLNVYEMDGPEKSIFAACRCARGVWDQKTCNLLFFDDPRLKSYKIIPYAEIVKRWKPDESSDLHEKVALWKEKLKSSRIENMVND